MLKEMNPEDWAAVAKQTAQIPTKRCIDNPSPHLSLEDHSKHNRCPNEQVSEGLAGVIQLVVLNRAVVG